MRGLRNDAYLPVMARLSRWAVFCIWQENLMTTSPKPRRLTSWLGRLISGRLGDPDRLPAIVERPCPVDVIEAAETDRYVQLLPDRLRDVVVLEYLTRMGFNEKAAQMKPPGSFKTYYRRLERAHYELTCKLKLETIKIPASALRAPVLAAA